MANPLCVSPVATTDNFQFLWSTSSHLKGIQRAAENQSGQSTEEIPALWSQKKKEKKTCKSRLKPWSISLAEQQPDSVDSRSVIEVAVHKNEIDLFVLVCQDSKQSTPRFPDLQKQRF